MKLSWREKWAKKSLIKRNRRILSNTLKRPIADSFTGNPKVTRTERMTFIEFEHVNVGISSNDNLDNPLTWIHEFVEHIVGKVILEILVEDGTTLSRMKDIICDGIFIKDIYGRWYNPTTKHIIAALCTNSSVDGIDITPEEYAELFGFKKRPRSVMDNAASFEEVRCRFDFGRGLQLNYCKKCENDFWRIKNENEY